MIASDAHHITGRKYNMRAAFDKLTKQYGQSMVNEFDNNARALVNGEPLVRWHETPIKKKVFFSAY